MKKRTQKQFRANVFPVAVVVAVFAIAAMAGLVYSQNLSNGNRVSGHSYMHAQNDSSGMMMPIAACNQMMQSLNISQSAINAMNQMMDGMMGSGSMQGMMQGS